MYIYNTVWLICSAKKEKYLYINNSTAFEHLFVYVMHLFTALVNCRVNIAHNQSADNADHIPPTFQTPNPSPPPKKTPQNLTIPIRNP